MTYTMRKFLHYFSASISLLFLTLLSNQALSQCTTSNGITTCTFDASGSWTVPCGVTSVTITIWGGGGGGGGSSANGSGGSGGGGGAQVTNTFVVTPGTVINYTIGAGGTAGAAAGGTGGSGGQTSVTSGVPAMSAAGGTGGTGNSGAVGVAGANGVSAGGTVTNGTNGVVGGASGGNGGNGGGASGGSGGLGQTNAAGLSGNAPGGGGGGGEDNGGGSGDRSGGAGGSGQISFTYTSSVTVPNAGTDQNACGTLTLAGNTPDAGWTGTWSVVSGTATITTPSSPTSTVTGIPSGTCATLRWTFSQAGCTDMTDDVVLCVPTVCNDEPCGAVSLTVNSGTCSYTSGSNVGATYSTGMVDPPCAVVNGPDVWYSIVVPASGQVQVSADGAGTGFDEMLTLYDGSCSNLQFAGCVSGSGSNAYPLTYAGAPGSTIYLRVNEGTTADAATGTFGICAYEATTAGVSQVLPGVTTTVTCGSTLNFYDTGGQGGTTSVNTSQPPPAGNYTNNTGTTWTICPSDPTQYVTISFSQFLLESGFDRMIISTDAGDVISQWTYNEGLGDVVSAQNPGECLIVYFQSDYSYTALGWEATVSCQSSATASQITNESQVNNCTGGGGVWICADGIYDTEAGAGAGIDEINEVTGGCWGAAGEVATSWFYFTTASSGVLAFEFVPSNSGHNINFALYGPTTDGVPPCPTQTGDAPIRCSFTDQGGSNTGLQSGQTDLYDGPLGNSFAAPLSVGAGETYALVVDVYQNGQPPTQTQIDFTGAAALDCTPVTLPIVLGDFYGINQDRQNILNWIVYSQMNNDFFTVERSIDGVNWQTVGTVDGAGTTQQVMYYSLIDKDPFYPITYYRLIQTDVDGGRSFSHIISISNSKDYDGQFISELRPNPTSHNAYFVFNGNDTETPLNVVILNELGQVIYNYNHRNLMKGMNSTINISDLANGLYVVVFTQGNERQTQRLSVVR